MITNNGPLMRFSLDLGSRRSCPGAKGTQAPMTLGPTTATPSPHPSKLMRLPLISLVVFFVAIQAIDPVQAKHPENATVDQLVTDGVLAKVFPNGEKIGSFSGKPRAAPVYRGGSVAGYIFSTRDATGSVGFSGKPIDIIVGLNLQGRITGAHLLHHDEPILVIGIPERQLIDYVDAFAGLHVAGRARITKTAEPEKKAPDMIAGASVSSAVIRDAIYRSARAIVRSRNLLTQSGGERLDRESFSKASWGDLVEDGSVVRLELTLGQVASALGHPLSADEKPDSLFVELYTGLISPPRIGENLIGKLDFNRLMTGAGTDDQAIFVAANGLYSFKGTGYVRSGRFDRIQLVQGTKTILLAKKHYRNVETFKIFDAPELREIGVFVVPAATGFDPLQRWRIDLLVNRETPGGDAIQGVFSLEYTLPDRYRIAEPGTAQGARDEAPVHAATAWQHVWEERQVRIAVLLVILAVLSGILVFQDSVVKNFRFYRTIRLGFLAVTVVWLGWYAGGQLTIVNVITFIHSFLGEFHWEFFLLDPIVFILWGYVAMALLFWGRGVFCGWLCPFGALQELLSEAARKLNFPQINLPFALHERLWPIKYIVFLGLFAVSFYSTNLAVLGAEVEPFKTAVTLSFNRTWPFVAYALGLLAVGLFIERFFCRYLCPLGAALAIPARLRMFDWLKRRYQCGEVCNLCAGQCTVQAIHPEGAINPNECIHCLNCQTIYFDKTTCPPLVAQEKRRERRTKLAAGSKTRFGDKQNA